MKQGKSRGSVGTTYQGKGRVSREVRIGQGGRGRAQGGERPIGTAAYGGKRFKGKGSSKWQSAPPAADNNALRCHAKPPPPQGTMPVHRLLTGLVCVLFVKGRRCTICLSVAVRQLMLEAFVRLTAVWQCGPPQERCDVCMAFADNARGYLGSLMGQQCLTYTTALHLGGLYLPAAVVNTGACLD